MSRHDDSDDAGWQEPRERGRRTTGRPRRSMAMIVTGSLAALVALALVGGSLFAYVKYREVWDSIDHVDVSSDLGTKRPPVDPHALNVLLIGSDSRSGKNGTIGGHEGIAGQRSDTVMVAHIAPGAHRAVVLSIPRDSVVPILACKPEGGTSGQTAAPSPDTERINATFAAGGPGCLWKTIEQTTHIHIDDFVELNFVGFEKVIDDLHGVSVCLPAPVNVAKSGLHLSAGRHHIYGSQALAFWRTREDLGEGSDLQRIQRDQYLMASLLQGIEKSGLLTSTSKMASVIGDVADHLSTNIENSTTMLQIAQSMRGLTSKSVQFIEVPSETYPANTAEVQWTTQSDQLFSAIAHDTKLPKTAKTAKKKAAASTTVDVVSPAKVNVEVLNGSGLQGVASEGSADLTARGFNVVGSGNAPNFSYTSSVVEYGSAADLPAARTLKRDLSDVELVHDSSLTAGTVDLILGSTFTSLKSPSASRSGTGNLTQTYGGITGSTGICHDSSAFSGPDGG